MCVCECCVYVYACVRVCVRAHTCVSACKHISIHAQTHACMIEYSTLKRCGSNRPIHSIKSLRTSRTPPRTSTVTAAAAAAAAAAPPPCTTASTLATIIGLSNSATKYALCSSSSLTVSISKSRALLPPALHTLVSPPASSSSPTLRSSSGTEPTHARCSGVSEPPGRE